MNSFAHTAVPPQTLLIDADDTLWENNIYFEQAIASFIAYLNHHAYSREEVREQLNRAERETIRTHGYGLSSFRRSLVDCFEQLSTEPISEEKHQQILSFAQAIADQEIELLEGVRESLPALASRHHLILMTKGNKEEQTDKLARSGIAEYFSSGGDPARERSRFLHRSLRSPQSHVRQHVDDRQQSPLRYQSRARRRIARCFAASSPHLDP